jgi:capsular polysaccharide transport system ATP-binding protein
MIRLVGLTKSYRTLPGRYYVFRDLNVEFPSGASIGILGRNGAGKTTLLRLLGGTDRPDRGKIETDGTISWPVGLGTGFQGSLSGRDNVRFVCHAHGLLREETREKIAFVEEFSSVGRHFDLPMNTYSSGMRAKVAFGMSMSFDFDYYLCDEVTAVGDASFNKKSRELFEQKKLQSHLIMVSHQPATIRNNCDIGAVISDGNIYIYDSVEDAINYYIAH